MVTVQSRLGYLMKIHGKTVVVFTVVVFTVSVFTFYPDEHGTIRGCPPTALRSSVNILTQLNSTQIY